MKQPRRFTEALVAFASGILFAVGLAIAGMTQPAKVVGFLDVAGAWDASLAFVMMGGIAVFFTVTRLVSKRPAPLLGGGFQLPTRRDIEPKLVLGSALFGIGWGLAGYCPGPGLTSLAAGSRHAITFVVAMAGGMLLFEWVQNARVRKSSTTSASSAENTATSSVQGGEPFVGASGSHGQEV